MNILVAGGAGFIGSHVVNAAVSAGHSVAVVDDMSTGRPENVSPLARFYKIDIRDEAALSDVFAREAPQVVSHHAAQVDLRRSVVDPLHDAKLNVLGSLSLLECCRKHGVKKVVYASSGGAIYGEPAYLPCDELHPIKPLSQYGVSKYTVELYLRVYAEAYGLRYTILRYANVYGPRQVPFGEAGVVAVFTYRMLQGEQVSIFGSGEQQRDFVYVGDVARANLAAMEAGDGQAYNVGCARGISVNQLFRELKAQTRYNLEPAYEPPKPGETFKIWLDARKAEAELGWTPKVGLHEGLALTLSSFVA